jgi:hypothetical protein
MTTSMTPVRKMAVTINAIIVMAQHRVGNKLRPEREFWQCAIKGGLIRLVRFAPEYSVNLPDWHAHHPVERPLVLGAAVPMRVLVIAIAVLRVLTNEIAGRRNREAVIAIVMILSSLLGLALALAAPLSPVATIGASILFGGIATADSGTGTVNLARPAGGCAGGSGWVVG